MTKHFFVILFGLIFFGLIFSSRVWAENFILSQSIEENLVPLEKSSFNKTLGIFKKMYLGVPQQSFDLNLNSDANFNPLAHLNLQDEHFYVLNALSTDFIPVTSVFLGQRLIQSRVPISVFADSQLKCPEVQNKIFNQVQFSNCDRQKCKARQNTYLGMATYDVFYKFIDYTGQFKIEIPPELLKNKSMSNLRYALIQFAYNWNDFFSSGLNLTLIFENDKHLADVVSLQVFLLTPHFLSDSLYKTNISKTIDTQTLHFFEFVKTIQAKSGSGNGNGI